MEKMSVKVAMSKMKKSFQKAIDELNYDNLAATNKAIGECYLELGGNLFADLVLKKQSENPEKSDLYAALVALMGYEVSLSSSSRNFDFSDRKHSLESFRGRPYHSAGDLGHHR